MVKRIKPNGSKPNEAARVALEEVFFEEHYPLRSTGGVLVFGVRNVKWAEDLKNLRRSVLVSRQLLDQQLTGQFEEMIRDRIKEGMIYDDATKQSLEHPNCKRLKDDVDFYKSLGYQHREAINKAYAAYNEFKLQAVNDAMLISLVNNQFDSAVVKGGADIRFKESVDPNHIIRIDEASWDRTVENTERLLEKGEIALPESTQTSPAEIKLRLLYVLMDQEFAAYRAEIDEYVQLHNVSRDEAVDNIPHSLGQLMFARYAQLFQTVGKLGFFKPTEEQTRFFQIVQRASDMDRELATDIIPIAPDTKSGTRGNRSSAKNTGANRGTSATRKKRSR